MAWNGEDRCTCGALQGHANTCYECGKRRDGITDAESIAIRLSVGHKVGCGCVTCKDAAYALAKRRTA